MMAGTWKRQKIKFVFLRRLEKDEIGIFFYLKEKELVIFTSQDTHYKPSVLKNKR